MQIPALRRLSEANRLERMENLGPAVLKCPPS